MDPVIAEVDGAVHSVISAKQYSADIVSISALFAVTPEATTWLPRSSQLSLEVGLVKSLVSVSIVKALKPLPVSSKSYCVLSREFAAVNVQYPSEKVL